jgi:hypothetical protein
LSFEFCGGCRLRYTIKSLTTIHYFLSFISREPEYSSAIITQTRIIEEKYDVVGTDDEKKMNTAQTETLLLTTRGDKTKTTKHRK